MNFWCHISEIQTFVVLLKVIKMGNESVEYNSGLADNDSKEFKEFVKSAKEGVSIHGDLKKIYL